jgi:hypothetical protein
MQIVRFFEDPNTPDHPLMIGIGTFEETWETDGGRREAVRLATTQDAITYPGPYAEYMQQFPEQAQQEAQEYQEPPRE